MKLTTKMIAGLKPCESRFNNFKVNYPDYAGDFKDFLTLENITYNDKVWVAVRLLNRNQLVHWSIFCAESIKNIYETKYPENKCLTILLDYLKTIPDFTELSQINKDKIWELRQPAAYAAADAAAYAAYAAAAAAYAADAAADAYAADADAYAADADAYAAAADAYAAAANAAANAADAAAYAAAADAAAYAAYAAAADAAAAYAAAREEQQNLNLLFLASLIE